MKSKWLATVVLLFYISGCTAVKEPSRVAYKIAQIPASATASEKLAYKELKSYLEKMNPELVTVRTDSGGFSPAEIILCRQGSNTAADIKPFLPELAPESFAIAVRGNRIYLVAADNRAIFYATYEFLQRLGCRWLAPGYDFYKGHNEYIPKPSQVEFTLLEDFIGSPVLKFRKLYVEEGHSHNKQNLLQLIAWMPKLRYNTLVVPIDYQGQGHVRWDNWRDALTPELKRRGIIIEVGGHGYQNFLNTKMEDGKLFAEHPQWFAIDNTGNRTKRQNWALCSSNEHAVEFLYCNLLDYLKKHPEIEIFDFWPPDGARWCTCPACKALGSPSERHAILVSKIAAKLRRDLPDVRLECIAYARALDPPESTTIDESVLIDFCPISQNFELQIYQKGHRKNEMYIDALQKWLKSFRGEISIYSYYRKYAWCSKPNIIPHYMQKDIQYYHKNGVKGISSYAEPGDWFTYELNHYVLGNLAWDPYADVDKLVDNFCAYRYGPQAQTARYIFNTLEDVVRYSCGLPHTTLKTPEVYENYLVKMTDCRQKIAKALAENNNKILTENLNRLNLMLQYAGRTIKIQKHRVLNDPVQERKEMVNDLIEFIRLNADKGVFVWHGRFSPNRQYKIYGVRPVPQKK